MFMTKVEKRNTALILDEAGYEFSKFYKIVPLGNLLKMRLRQFYKNSR